MSARSTLPFGDIGRVVNSFVSEKHVDAIKWQRDFRQSLYDNRETKPYLEQICGRVYLVAIKHLNLKYVHAARLPDHRRIINMTSRLSSANRTVVGTGGIPKCWYPQKATIKLARVYRDTPVGTNTYIIEVPDPLPWKSCTYKACCSPKKKIEKV